MGLRRASFIAPSVDPARAPQGQTLTCAPEISLTGAPSLTCAPSEQNVTHLRTLIISHSGNSHCTFIVVRCGVQWGGVGWGGVGQ